MNNNKLLGKFVVDIADYIRDWTANNIPAGAGLEAIAVQAKGLGISIGMYAVNMSKHSNIKPETIEKIVTDAIREEINKAQQSPQ